MRLLLSRHLPQDGERDLREFAWHYLWSKYQETLEVPQFDHGSRIHALAYLSDGSKLATGGSDGSLKLWDLHVGRSDSFRTLSVSDHPMQSMAVSPDGQIASVGRTRGPIEICDIESGNTVVSLPLDEHFSATAIAFSPDGRWLATAIFRAGNEQGKHFVYLWNTQDWSVVYKLTGRTRSIEDLAFSVNSQLLATASLDHTVQLWDVDSGSAYKTLKHRHMVYAVTFSPDGKYLASGGYNYEIRLWETETWEQVSTIREPGHSVTSLAFSPNSQVLASGGRDRVAHLWNISTGKTLAIVRGHADDVQSVQFSRDGKNLASASLDGTVRITEIESPSPEKETSGNWITRMAHTRDGQRLISVAGLDESRLTIWDLRTNHRELLMPTALKLPFDIRSQDAIMQFDVVGDRLDLRAWLPGEPMPLEPQMSAHDDVFEDAGFVRVCSGVGVDGANITEIRHIVVADEPIVDVVTFLSGDFDDNGVIDVRDVSSLQVAIRNDGPAAFDITGDQAVTQDDLKHWVGEVRNTWFGDSNLDGEFNSSDFVVVFSAGEFEDGIAGNSGWADGDWNGDAEFDSADFVLAFQEGGYEKGPRVATANVPEPLNVVPILIGAILVVRSARCRQAMVRS